MTVRCLVPCFSALVARERKWLHFPTSVNIYWNRVSRSWSMLVICALLRSLKSNSVEGGWTDLRQSNTRRMVGRLESFIGGLVLVNGPGCSVAVCWNHVGGTSRRHGCYSILNLSVKSLMEFHHYGLRIGVTGFRDKVLEFIEVFIHGATLLEIGCRFQSVDGCWVCIDWTKLPFELILEVFSIDEFIVAYIFRLLLPSEYTGRPLSCSSCLHVWHGPDNFACSFVKDFGQRQI